ncbi:MAG: annexin, partial [Acidobacteriota bacterium]
MFGFLEDIGHSVSSTVHGAAGAVSSLLGPGAEAPAAAAAPPPSLANAGHSVTDVGRGGGFGGAPTNENAYRADHAAPEPTKADAKPDAGKPGAGKEEEKKPDPKVVAATSATLARAMEGWGTNEKAIMDSLRGKSKEEITAIRAEYKKQTGNDLDGDLKGDLSGKDLKEAQAYMSGDPVKSAVAALQNSQGGIFGIGSDPEKIMATLKTLRPEDQAAVRAAYKQESGQSIDDLLHREMKGDELKQAQQELADKFSLGLGKGSEAADGIAKKSPTLVGKLSALQDAGWTVTYGAAGKGSFTDRGKKTIVIDPNEKSSPTELITTAAHESGHAAYTPDAYVGPEGLT